MTEPALYADWRVDGAPPWLQDGQGSDWLEAFGIIADTVQQYAICATRGRFPTKAPIGGLDVIGAALKMPRCRVREPAESDASYAARLALPISTWAGLGGDEPFTTLCALLGLTDIQIHDRADWAVPRRHDVVIHVRQPHPWTGPRKIGSGWNVGDGTAVGITGMTAAQARALKALFYPFCASHTRVLFKVTFSGSVVGGGWSVGDGTVVGGKSANIWIRG